MDFEKLAGVLSTHHGLAMYTLADRVHKECGTAYSEREQTNRNRKISTAMVHYHMSVLRTVPWKDMPAEAERLLIIQQRMFMVLGYNMEPVINYNVGDDVSIQSRSLVDLRNNISLDYSVLINIYDGVGKFTDRSIKIK
jgi:hypothetical protein